MAWNIANFLLPPIILAFLSHQAGEKIRYSNFSPVRALGFWLGWKSMPGSSVRCPSSRKLVHQIIQWLYRETAFVYRLFRAPRCLTAWPDQDDEIWMCSRAASNNVHHQAANRGEAR